MIPVTILHEAEAELWEAVAFYESRSSGLGLDFEKEIKDSVRLLQQFPDRWPLREDGTRRYLMHRFPYLVVCLCQKNPSLDYRRCALQAESSMPVQSY